MSLTNLCPCGKEVAYDICCFPIIQGKRNAVTAEELLRARYSAFVKSEIDFILSSHHSRTKSEVKRQDIEEWSKNSDWLGLKVVQSEAGQEKDEKGTLIFSASYRDRSDEKTHEHWEKSFFEKENGQWRFVDAHGVQLGTFRRAEPKIGRNDPCQCGSGKKYKKCCGA